MREPRVFTTAPPLRLLTVPLLEVMRGTAPRNPIMRALTEQDVDMWLMLALCIHRIVQNPEVRFTLQMRCEEVARHRQLLIAGQLFRERKLPCRCVAPVRSLVLLGSGEEARCVPVCPRGQVGDFLMHKVIAVSRGL